METLDATVSAWGKSTAIRIPASLVKRVGLQIGQKVQFESAGDGAMILRAVSSKPNLEALLSRVTPANLPDEADVSWGKPCGTELW
jgi:antitoxin component of MazEF toxin-antitoxin module